MKKLYPLKFTPILKEKIWGNENWLLSDMEDAVSVVENGFLADNDLSDILETYLGDLVGDEVFEYFNLQFPLIVKIINAREPLSVQVHPDDETAMERYYSYGKDEYLLVTEAKKDARIYMGFKRDVTATEFYEACHNGTAAELLNCITPRKGDVYPVKAGTVHAVGSGVTAIEVSQPSVITFRLFDWGRENDPGKCRDIHLEEALDIIDFKAKSDSKEEIDKFCIRQIPLTKTLLISPETYKSMIVFVGVDGESEIRYKDDIYTLSPMEAILIPASLDELSIAPKENKSTVLQVTMPHFDLEEDSYIKDKLN